MDAKTQSRVWDAIVDTLSLDSNYDHDGAVRVADEVKTVMKFNGIAAMQMLKDKRRERRVELAKNIAGWTTVVLVVLGIAAGIFSLFKYAHHTKHFAHIKRSEAPTLASNAIFDYYGQNDLPPNLKLISAQHSALFGRPTWKVLYRNDKTQACVYLWKVYNDGQNSDLVLKDRVEHGAACDG